MSNNISASITMDVADLTARRAVASAELKALQKDLRDLAETARTTGRTPELNASLLAAGDAAAKARSQVRLIDDELKKVAPAAESAHSGMAGITRELLVLGRETGRGDFTRMSGSVTILAQRMGLLTPAVLGVGAAVAAIAAPFAIFSVAVEQGSQELAHFQNAMEATNGYAGVTVSQLQELASGLSKWGHEGIGAATKELEALAASGQFTGDTLALIGADATRMSQLTGESADKWNAEFAKMSQGVAKFAAEYQARYGQLTTAQFEYIQQLEQQGQKESAEHALAKDIYDYLSNQAPQNLGILEKAWNGLGQAISGAWDALKAFGRDSNADQIARLQARVADQASWGLNANNSGYVAGLERQIAALRQVEGIQQTIAGWQARATEAQKEGVAAAQKLHEQFEASKTSGEKLRDALAQIDINLGKAVAADPGNAALYQREAAAARAQAQRSDAPTRAPDQVAVWTEALHQQEIASGEFFKDQTANELAFWQSKLSLTQSGSKDWLAVQSKIYEAQKALAHQSYDDNLAALNDQIEADRQNWAAEQADWNKKLDFIKAHYGDQGQEYKDAHRQFEAAERQHQQQMAQIARDGAQEALSELKSNLDAQKALRQQDAQAQEQQIQAQARFGANPLAEVQAAAQIAAVHQQMLDRELADTEAYHARQVAILDEEIASALAAYGADSDAYKKAVDAKLKAEQQFANQVRVLQNQMAVQAQQDALKVQQAWHSAIDPVVQSFGQGVEGMIKGTETLTQALEGVGEAILNVIITAIERWVAAQIVAMVTGQAAGKAAAAQQIASNIALAGSGGVASMAAAPFPIDLGAPAFGAAMAAQAAAFGALASFDVGTNYVPNDMVAQIHEGERIIPAADNAALMAAVSASNRPGARPVQAGGNVAHHWTVYANDAKSFEQWLNQPGTAAVMQRFADRQVRNLKTGARP